MFVLSAERVWASLFWYVFMRFCIYMYMKDFYKFFCLFFYGEIGI